MQRKKQRDVLFTIENTEMVRTLLSPENKKLVCKFLFFLSTLTLQLFLSYFLGFDVHLEWCGRCDNMEQNYRSLYL